MEPVICQIIKMNCIFIDKECAHFSMKRIDETWMYYEEIIARRFPGYCLDNEYLFIECKSDITVSMDELLSLFRSKDIERYE